MGMSAASGGWKHCSKAHILLGFPSLVLWVGPQQSLSDPSRECNPKTQTSYKYHFAWWETQRAFWSLWGWAVCLRCRFAGIVPVCHHRDHSDLHLGRVSQVPAHTQAGLYSGLLHLFLHHGLPDDHSGKLPAGRRLGMGAGCRGA